MIQPNLPGEILAVFRELGIGLTNHGIWLKRLHRTLVCGEQAAEDDFCQQAHHKCMFGQWFYGTSDLRLKALPQFEEVGILHKQIHNFARELLEINKSGNEITTAKYDEFIDVTLQFRLAVQGLQYNLVSEVCAIDHLTGVWNHYALSYKLSKHHEDVRFTGKPCVIAMLNFDHLGLINDREGYAAGDTVITTVMEYLAAAMKTHGEIFRYSSEEFLFVLPKTDMDNAKLYLEQLRQQVKDLAIRLQNGAIVRITISIGMTMLDHLNSEKEAIELSRHAMVSAKAGGRDRVCAW